MRPFIAYLSLIFVFCSGCEGPEGPMGPEGPPGKKGPSGLQGPVGQDATAMMEEFNLYDHLDTLSLDTARYDTVDRGFEVFWRGNIQGEYVFSKVVERILTPGVVDSGAVLLYFQQDTSKHDWRLFTSKNFTQYWPSPLSSITETGQIYPSFPILKDTLKVNFGYATWWSQASRTFDSVDVGPVPFQRLIKPGAKLRLVGIPGTVPDKRMEDPTYEAVARRYDLPLR